MHAYVGQYPMGQQAGTLEPPKGGRYFLKKPFLSCLSVDQGQKDVTKEQPNSTSRSDPLSISRRSYFLSSLGWLVFKLIQLYLQLPSHKHLNSSSFLQAILQEMEAHHPPRNGGVSSSKEWRRIILQGMEEYQTGITLSYRSLQPHQLG